MQELHNRTIRKGPIVTITINRTPLTVSDRCDRCGAQAFVRVYLDSDSTLQFCAHHFREHETKLRAIAIEIQDESDAISNKNDDIEASSFEQY